jgi:hypothetical protein
MWDQIFTLDVDLKEELESIRKRLEFQNNVLKNTQEMLDRIEELLQNKAGDRVLVKKREKNA